MTSDVHMLSPLFIFILQVHAPIHYQLMQVVYGMLI